MSLYRLTNSGILTTARLEGDDLVVERLQDCAPVDDLAQSLHNEGLHGSEDMKLAAVIPNVIIERYCDLAGITYLEYTNNPEHKRRILNDPSLSHFRVWKGRV